MAKNDWKIQKLEDDEEEEDTIPDEEMNEDEDLENSSAEKY